MEHMVFPFLRLFDAHASLNMQLGGAFVQFWKVATLKFVFFMVDEQ